MPWLADQLDDRARLAFGKAPNGEFILDPAGKIVRKQFWCDPRGLRAALVDLVGLSGTFTKPEDLPTKFVVKKSEIASGVVPRIELVHNLKPLKLEPVDDGGHPYFAKLRVEATPSLPTGEGEMYLGVYLDPIYEVHWNNRAGKVKIEFEPHESVSFEQTTLLSPEIAEDADIDPRQFLISGATREQTEDSPDPPPIKVAVTYTVCDNDETFCLEITQRYLVYLKKDERGTRPGIFLNGYFAKTRSLDKNGDGNLTKDELPEGEVSLFMGHMDYNADDLIEADEVDRFLAMFNDGAGPGAYNDGQKPKN